MTGKIYCNTMQWLDIIYRQHYLSLHVALSAKFTRTCYLHITTEFSGSFNWLEVRRISQVPDESCLKKTPVFGYAKNKDADQPANLCSLIIVFVNLYLDRTTHLISISEIPGL